MCFGGGGSQPASVITMPDTGSYDRMYDRQLQMMQMSQNSELNTYQSQLDEAVMNQQDLVSDLRDLRKEKAEDIASVEAEATRMANIIGTPPPELSANAPVVGSARKKPKTQAKKGKRGLRIARQSPNPADSVGYNLNI